MHEPVEVLPGIFVVEDLVPEALRTELVETCEAVNPFRKTQGATLYSEVLLPHISESLSDRFDAWMLEACVPIITDSFGITPQVYQGSSRLSRALTDLGILNPRYDPPSPLERLLRLRGLKRRLLPAKLESSPQTFVTKYSQETQPSTGLHCDKLAGVSVVLNLNDDYVGGGTCFASHDQVVTSRCGGGGFSCGRDEVHRGAPVESGHRYITSTWFHV